MAIVSTMERFPLCLDMNEKKWCLHSISLTINFLTKSKVITNIVINNILSFGQSKNKKYFVLRFKRKGIDHT